MHPFDSAGGYVNFMIDDEGESRVKASYRENYPRLAAIKKKYDPTNFFRVNQNIGWRFIGLGFLMGYAEGFCQAGLHDPQGRSDEINLPALCPCG